MSEYTKYTSLKRIISYFLDEYNLNHDEMDKAWVMAFRALVALNQSVAAEAKTIRIAKNGNNTVTLPSDYLSWSKIGVMTDNGKVSTLRISNSLSTLKDSNPDRLNKLTADVMNSVPILISSPYYYNYYAGGLYQNLFGVGGGLAQYGECRVDEANNVIILPPDFRYDSILLEYVSSPEDDEDYQIQTVLQEAVIAFLAWKYKLAPREEYYAAVIEGRRSLPGKRVTLQEINQVIRETGGMYIKA
jgi:hypothetical protein